MNPNLVQFCTTSVIAKSVTFNGQEVPCFFRELSADQAEDLFGGIDADPKKNKGLRNRVIASILCNQDGTPALTAAEAGTLKLDLANKIQQAALEVNGFGKSEEAEAAAKNA